MDVPPEVAIEIEQRKLAIEERRIANEERQTGGWKPLLVAIATPLAIVGSFVVAGLTIQHENSASNNQADLEISENKKQAELDFDLAAAEIAMNSDSPVGTENRAEALQELFPNRLSGFADSFVPEEFQSQTPEEGRHRILESAVLDRPAEAKQLIRAWIAFHEEDEAWATGVLERLQ